MFSLRLVVAFCCLLLWPAHVSSQATKVLIVEPVVDGFDAYYNEVADTAEYKQAVALGYTITTVSFTVFQALLTADFRQYNAIIVNPYGTGFGTSGSSTSTLYSFLANSKSQWGPAVTGNVILSGDRYRTNAANGVTLLNALLAFTVAGQGTGFYLQAPDMGASAGSNIGFLDVFGPTFQVETDKSSSTAYRVADGDGGMSLITQSDLQWTTGHVAALFSGVPAPFVPFAVSDLVNSDVFTYPGGVTGSPYIVARGAIIVTCGDGVVTKFERCDEGAATNGLATSQCTADCFCQYGTISGTDTCVAAPRCGDGTVDAGEQCDAGDLNNGAFGNACGSDCRCRYGRDSNLDCVPASCGDGEVNRVLEECDDGSSNGVGASLCTSDCMCRFGLLPMGRMMSLRRASDVSQCRVVPEESSTSVRPTTSATSSVESTREQTRDVTTTSTIDNVRTTTSPIDRSTTAQATDRSSTVRVPDRSTTLQVPDGPSSLSPSQASELPESEEPPRSSSASSRFTRPTNRPRPPNTNDPTSPESSELPGVPEGSELPPSSSQPPAVEPSPSASDIPASSSPAPSASGAIGVENIFYVEDASLEKRALNKRQDESLVVRYLFDRDILGVRVPGVPFYPAVIGFPEPGDLLTVTTTFTIGNPDPTPIFTFKLCEDCPETVTTVNVPGYTPGTCKDCEFVKEFNPEAGPIRTATVTERPTVTEGATGTPAPGGDGLVTVITVTQTTTLVYTTCEYLIDGYGMPYQKCYPVTTWGDQFTFTIPSEFCTTFVSVEADGGLTTCVEALPEWVAPATALQPYVDAARATHAAEDGEYGKDEAGAYGGEADKANAGQSDSQAGAQGGFGSESATEQKTEDVQSSVQDGEQGKSQPDAAQDVGPVDNSQPGAGSKGVGQASPGQVNSGQTSAGSAQGNDGYANGHGDDNREPVQVARADKMSGSVVGAVLMLVVKFFL